MPSIPLPPQHLLPSILGGIALVLLVIILRSELQRRAVLRRIIQRAVSKGYEVSRVWGLFGGTTVFIGRTAAGASVIHTLEEWQRRGLSTDYRVTTQSGLAAPFPGQLYVVRGMRWGRFVRPKMVRHARLRARPSNRNDDHRYAIFVDSLLAGQHSAVHELVSRLTVLGGWELRVSEHRFEVEWVIDCSGEEGEVLAVEKFEACHDMLRSLTT